MKTYAGVVRVSHMGKRKADSEEFHSAEDQAQAIREWARRQKVKVELLEAELDVKSHLPLDQRPAMSRAIEGVESGRYAGIVVAYLSRFGRNIKEELLAWERIEAAGGEVVSIREGIDSDSGATADGRLVRNLLMGINTAERERHAERFAELRYQATMAGVWQRRQTPRGYRKGADRHLAPDAHAEEVREAFAAFLAGTSIRQIANQFKMTPSGVRQLLANRVYLGELRVGEHVNVTAHPPLIDEQTFDAVQRKLADGVRPARRGKGPSLLAGLVRCASCGHAMSRGSSNGGPAYLCPTQHSGRRCPAPAAIMAARLESYVEPIALAELARLRVEASEGDQIATAQAAVTATQAELDAYLDAVSAAEVGAEAFAAGARKRKEAIEAAKDALHAELARRPALPAVGSGAEVWEELSASEKNALLRSLLGAVVVRPAGRGRRVPASERVRVLAYGADLGLQARKRGNVLGVAAIPFPDADGVGVLSAPAGEDRLQAAGGAA